MNYDKEKIWIIGASSGIGASLAQALSSNGATLLLSARTEDSLKQIAESLGEHHDYLPLDINNPDSISSYVKEAHQRLGNFDRVIFLAGLYDPTPITEINLKQLNTFFQVNVIGAIALVNSIIPYLNKGSSDKKPQICLVASVAGWMGLPNAQPYGATKAALINFTESLYAEVHKEIDVKLINPGFVATRLTAKNRFKMPFCLTPEDAAKRIVQQLNKNSFEIHFPKRLTYLMKFLRYLPYSLQLPIIRRLTQ